MRVTSSPFMALVVFLAGMFIQASDANAHPRRYRHTHRRVITTPPARYFVDPFDRRYFFDPVTGRYVLRGNSWRRSWRHDDDDDSWRYRRWRSWR